MTLTVPVDQIVARNSNGLLGKHDSWERVRLGDVATIQNGAAFKSEHFNNEGRGMPLLRIRDVLNDRTEAFYDGPYEDRMIVEPGDLVIGMDGDFNSGLWRGPRALLNQRVCRVHLHSDLLDPRFVFWTLQGYLDAVNEVTSSVTVKHLSSRTVSELPLPLPPRREQDRILSALGSRMGDVDSAAADLSRARGLLEILRKSVLNGLAESNSRFQRLDNVGDVYVGATPKRSDSRNWGGQIPWVSSGEVAFCHIRGTREHLTEAGLGKREQRLHPPGTVLLAMYGEGRTRGQAAVLDIAAATNQAVAAIRPDRSKVLPEFVYYALMARYEEIRRIGQGGQQINLNKDLVKSIEIPCPPLEEQERALAQIRAHLNEVEAVDLLTGEQVETVDGLRRAILQSAFNGKLTERATQ